MNQKTRTGNEQKIFALKEIRDRYRRLLNAANAIIEEEEKQQPVAEAQQTPTQSEENQKPR